MTDEEEAAMEAAAVARIKELADLLADEAAMIWHWADGEGGYVLRIIDEAFAAHGLGPAKYPDDPRFRKRKPIAPNTRAQVYARDGLKCVRCGSTKQLTVDHIVAHVRGGSDDIDNLQTMCRTCNTSKGAR